jgi:replicative DNA helicase Mcm
MKLRYKEIILVDIKGRFNSFLEQFEDKNGHLKYHTAIKSLEQQDRRTLYIDYADLLLFDPRLAEELYLSPTDTLSEGSEALKERLASVNPNYLQTASRFHLRITNLMDHTSIRRLRAKQFELLTSVQGIIYSASEIKSIIVMGAFKCASCGEGHDGGWYKEFKDGIFNPPYQCRNDMCQRKGSVQLIEEKSEFIDFQTLTIQDKPEDILPGQMPTSLTLVLQDDIVDLVRPGDRITTIGILKPKIIQQLKKGRQLVYSKAFQVVSITRELDDEVELAISDDEEDRFKKLAQDPFIVEKCIHSIVPTLRGNDLMKEAICYVLFGGIPYTSAEGVRMRGESHILFLGDPGTGKSVALRAAAELAPRAVFSSGKGSSAAGLCGAVIKDPETGEWILEAGVLSIASGGMAMIDEFEKMTVEDRRSIHEPMEQGFISIAKANIRAQLNAQSSIIAAGNPRRGRWNPYKDLADNISLDPAILSRFDLIFILEDTPNPFADEQKARHVTKLRRAREQPEQPVIPHNLLKKYIHYTRQNCFPQLSDEAEERLVQYYLEMRKKSQKITEKGAVSPIAITLRQLEALIRLSEARARIHLRDTISLDDAVAVIRLFDASLEKYALDKETGTPDVDMQLTGISTASRRELDKIEAFIEKVLDEAEEKDPDEPVLIKEILDKARVEGLDVDNVNKTVEEWTRRGIAFEPRPGAIKRP